MGNLFNRVIKSNCLNYLLLLGLGSSLTVLNHQLKTTQEVEILDKREYQNLLGKPERDYKLNMKDRTYWFSSNQNMRELKTGETYVVTINNLIYLPPNIISAKRE